MNLNAESSTPIYIQIAEWIENEILADRLISDGKVYSQYQLAEMFNINPATAGKGLTILLENNILYKKRGLGMFVLEGAKEQIVKKRRDEKLTILARDIVMESKRLFVSDEELIELIRKVQKGG
ncbi:GntR family transcriptional regulator [Ureibacillus acetophenoni]|uniref:DNA-binding transcriptional regulator YhcF (GntR family) n=1 Tax=Ureibacillus acetophenoni TaxID=614649 RepID=A0A285UKL6_9BACL|nr:GntR family transcriptional regulator [Ureibacillus acetophenoni]SOC42430.1 DNA-binding transcriptional regulator YhcF (GntR family) [Ureibacillus acetophenoni]